MARHHDWPVRMTFFIQGMKKRNNADQVTFSWKTGEGYQCLGFLGEAMEAVLGENLYTKHLGQDSFDSALGAMRLLKSRGFDSVDQLLGSLFNERQMNYVQRGDIVLVGAQGEVIDDPELEGLRLVAALADPPYFWVVSSELGLARGSLRDAVKAFAVE